MSSWKPLAGSPSTSSAAASPSWTRTAARWCDWRCCRSRIPAGRSAAGRWAARSNPRSSRKRCSSWTTECAGSTAWESGRESFPWVIGWSCLRGKREKRRGKSAVHTLPSSRFPPPLLAQLIPRQRRRLLAAFTRKLLDVGPEGLAVPAGGAHRVREREQPAHALDLARLAPHDAPALRRMVADLEEAPVDRDVAPIHVQHDDVARRDADHRIPGAAAQQVRAGLADAGPALGLEPRGRRGTEGSSHAVE